MKNIKKITALLTTVIMCLTVFSDLTLAYENKTIAESEVVKNTMPAASEFKASGKIWIAGDSIAADHSYENETDYARFVHGWGEIIGNYLTDDAQVYNLAISGQTAKFFTEEDNYRQIIDGIGEGDLLLISFGHNDYKSAGNDHSTLPSSTEGSYKWYLKNYYIEPALKAGAMPVLCTSVVLCQFVDGHINENQNQYKFVRAMRELYYEYMENGVEIGFIDTFMLTQSALNLHANEAASYYALKYDRGIDSSGNRTTSLDHVHFSYKGADMTADIIAENLFVMFNDFNRYNKYAGMEGEGTKDSPYLITNSAAFFQIMQDVELNSPNKYYKLVNDIECVIGNTDWIKRFYANLDGGGHTITNPINRSLKSFIDENYGNISNLNLSYGLYHTSSDVQTPFIKENYGTISNCSADGSIWIDCFLTDNELWCSGIFADKNKEGAVITECSSDVNMTLNSDIPITVCGAFAGINNGTINECVNTGFILLDVTNYFASNNLTYENVVCVAGGICGIAYNLEDIVNCAPFVIPEARCRLKGKIVYINEESIAVSYSDIKERFGEDINEEKADGDVNFDKKVDLNDATLALKFAVGIEMPTERQIVSGDIDLDGKISLKDATIILKLAVGINN